MLLVSSDLTEERRPAGSAASHLCDCSLLDQTTLPSIPAGPAPRAQVFPQSVRTQAPTPDLQDLQDLQDPQDLWPWWCWWDVNPVTCTQRFTPAAVCSILVLYCSKSINTTLNKSLQCVLQSTVQYLSGEELHLLPKHKTAISSCSCWCSTFTCILTVWY